MRIWLKGRLMLVAWSLMALVVLAGCASNPVTQQATPKLRAPSPTATPGSTITPPPLNGPPGTAPSDCPASPSLQTMTQNNFGGGFSSPISFQGASPVWQLGLPTDGSPLHVSAGNDLWPSTKVMWVVGPNVVQPVTLTGHELRTGTLLWFEIFPSGPRQSAVLDPTDPNRGSTDNSTGHWNIWGIGIVVLAAGCYEVDVSSPEGSWHAIYAIGQ
jgi:hypothetical protein